MLIWNRQASCFSGACFCVGNSCVAPGLRRKRRRSFPLTQHLPLSALRLGSAEGTRGAERKLSNPLFGEGYENREAWATRQIGTKNEVDELIHVSHAIVLFVVMLPFGFVLTVAAATNRTSVTIPVSGSAARMYGR
jgi:hypothetical protein